jgi:GSH-dependent disulfide-bond oxidoreductase
LRDNQLEWHDPITEQHTLGEQLMIDCYTWKTGNGRKAILMLAETGLAHKIIPIDISKGEHKTPEYTAINPNQVVPAIIDRDVAGGPITIFESGAILTYLAEKSGKLQPSTPVERAACSQWMFWHSATFVPAVLPLHLMAQGRIPKEPAAEAAAKAKVRTLYDMLDKRLQNSTYLAGPSYSIADIMMSPMLTRRTWHGVELAELPALKRWYEVIVARPAAAEAFSDTPLK